MKIGTWAVLAVLRHPKQIKTKHAGALLVGNLLDKFEVTDKNEKIQAVVHLTPSVPTGNIKRKLAN
jgi:hypothetical protein